MKKIVFLIIFSTFIVGSANAQFAFGIKGGLTISDNNIDVIPDTVTDFIYGYHGGVYFKFGKGLFGFQPEIMFVRKGTKLNDESSDYYRQINLNYIDVPLLVRAGISIGGSELYFNFGPYVGYAISAKIKENTFDAGQNVWTTEEYDYDFDHDFTDQWDGGVIMGAGLRLFEKLIIEARYNQGILHIANDNYTSSNNKYLNISLGVQF
ncbi:MAG: porin family protein [Bacteroidales bacterium]|nr:porin family protein [Bacteroidales bacterium]